MILLYRNPFDNIISKFYYCWRNREGQEDRFSHPREVTDEVLASFVTSYNGMKDLYARDGGGRAILLSYEQLFLQPHSTMQSLLTFLNVPVYPGLIRLCVNACSIDEARREEAIAGEAIQIHKKRLGLRGSFARSGRVGQWKEYFSQNDIDYIHGELEKNGISHLEFCFDAEAFRVPGGDPEGSGNAGRRAAVSREVKRATRWEER